jgi:hypothetical protein
MARSKIAEFARKRPPYFWWILAHALALCFCAISWILTTYIFENPELPKNYALLKKIGQAPTPQPFTVLKAPEGESLRPEAIYRQFAAYAAPENDAKLHKINSLLLRSYLQSYKDSIKPTYIEGTYRILQIRPLSAADLLSPGFVIRAQALVQPEKDRPASAYPVIIESIFPCDNKAAFTWFKPGDLLRMQKVPDCMAILHISMLGTTDEPMVNLTLAPIAYSEYKIGESRVVSTTPPVNVNLQAGFPMFAPMAPKPTP